MGVPVEQSGWSGDGEFTAHLADVVAAWEPVASVRIADAPTGRDGAGYSFLANDVFVTFHTRPRGRSRLAFWRPQPIETVASVDDLVAHLSGVATIGPPAYHDGGMLQYLHTQRVVAPYQSRGVKVVELVRIYVGLLPPSGDNSR